MYRRETEVREMQPNDVYKLGVIMDDNNCWKKLMEIIPKELDAQASSADGALDWEQATKSGLKYNTDHIRLIESAIKRPGESRLYSQILFDEWGTSGRKHERPTMGVLLQLLVKAELFRAADFVATKFLNERPPERPQSGPAAKIDITFSGEIFHDIEDMVNDSTYYPGTESINDNANYANSVADNNKDFYTKYQRMDKHVSAATIEDNVAPKPPPRALRTARLQMQQQLQLQQQTLTANEATTAEAINRSEKKDDPLTQRQSEISIGNHVPTSQSIPNFSAIRTKSSEANTNVSTTTESSNEHEHSPLNTESTNLSEAPIPMISILAEMSTKSSDSTVEAFNSAIDDNEILPVISALNLNGEHDDSSRVRRRSVDELSDSPNQSDRSRSSSSLSNDDSIELPDLLANINENDAENGDEEDEDISVPNLSIFGQPNSNNDSSLTTVTGTSGENSFELSMNDCSSASNENIPCLSALKQ